MRKMKVIVRAWELPDGSVVTKRTGQRELTLLRALTIYGPEGDKRTIQAEPGVVFLTSQAGKFNAVKGSTEVVWRATWDEIVSVLGEKETEK